MFSDTAFSNTKIGEVENKIPNVSGLVITTVIYTIIGEVDNKIPNVSGLVKKTVYNVKISDIESGHYFWL